MARPRKLDHLRHKNRTLCVSDVTYKMLEALASSHYDTSKSAVVSMLVRADFEQKEESRRRSGQSPLL